MSVTKKLLEASGGGGESTYVDDVFSTYLYIGEAVDQGIQNGINLGDFGVGTSTKFNGTSDYLSRSSDLTGNADGKTVTFSCWLRWLAEDGTYVVYGDTSGTGFRVTTENGGNLSVRARNAAGSQILYFESNSAPLGTDIWVNLIVSVDMANASNRYIYANDTAVGGTWATYTNDNIDFTRTAHAVGAFTTPSNYWLGNMAHVYLDYTYRDLSTASNRRIFIDANGGSTSASSLAALNPIMYLPMTTAYAVGKNAGTGGDFTANGSPTIVENGTEYVADSGKGGLVWIKRRDAAVTNQLVDTERGQAEYLQSNETSPEINDATSRLTSFNNNGFSLGTGGEVNSANADYASWTFAKQEGFFDVVTYTGNGVAGRTVPHNLGSVPGMIIVKGLAGDHWYVYHRTTGATKYLILNLNIAAAAWDGSWNDTEPTDSVFTVGGGSAVNGNGLGYVAYVFAHDAQEFGTDSDESIIKCGSYVGNGNDDGPEIDLGWEPQWLLVKNATANANWNLIDTMRGTTPNRGYDNLLYPNTADAEETWRVLYPTATGFKVDDSGNSWNGSGNTYIYMAIRRPMKPAEEFEPDELFAMDVTASGSPMAVSGFPVDMGFVRSVGSSSDTYISGRLTQNTYLKTNSTAASINNNSFYFDYSNGYMASNWNTNEQAWMFRRAPGFFDVVAYEGDGTTGGIAHNLAAVPEMYWIKRTNYADGQGWMVYHKDAVATSAANAQSSYLTLNSGDPVAASTSRFGNIAPTTTTFGVSSSSANETGADYIAFLWASVPGICDIGTYTGTGAGTTIDIDCGFTNGARFILIKRTSDVGDWYYWDTLRGIVSGADSYLALNKSNSATTVWDWIDPLGSGFTVTSSAGNDVNVSGGEYIYMAIA